MAHDLATKTNGQTALWLNGTPAWHKLGKVWTEADGEITLARVMEEAGLDFHVEKRPMFFGATTESKMGMDLVTQGQPWATVRTDTQQQLGTVGHIYKPFQNSEAFAFLEEVTGMGHVSAIEAITGRREAAVYESAGLLAHGTRTFVSVRLGDDIVLDPQGAADAVRRYIFVTNAHDGTGKVTAAASPVRVVCSNTLNYGLSQATAKLEVMHTEGGINRLKVAAKTIAIMRDYYEEFEQDALNLFGTTMSNAEFDKFMIEVALPLDSAAPKITQTRVVAQREKARELFRNARTQENIRNTRWGALQALTERAEHHDTVRVPKSLLLDAGTPRTLQEDIAKGARVVNARGEDDKKSQLHRQLLTWRR